MGKNSPSNYGNEASYAINKNKNKNNPSHLKNADYHAEYHKLQMHYAEQLKNYQNETMESVAPKGLLKYSKELANRVINHNSFTRKHINAERAEAAHRAIAYLISRDIPIHVALGITANAIAENGMSTASHKHGLGIFQWIGTRAKMYRKLHSTLPGNTELEKQLSFMLHELKTTEKSAGIALQSAQTPEEAARIFLVKFERPKIKNITERSALATGLREFTNK